MHLYVKSGNVEHGFANYEKNLKRSMYEIFPEKYNCDTLMKEWHVRKKLKVARILSDARMWYTLNCRIKNALSSFGKWKTENNNNDFVWFSSLQVNVGDRGVDNLLAIKGIVRGHFRVLVLQYVLEEGIKPCKENREDNWFDEVATLFWQAAKLVKLSATSIDRVLDILLQRNTGVCFKACHVFIPNVERVNASHLSTRISFVEPVRVVKIQALEQNTLEGKGRVLHQIFGHVFEDMERPCWIIHYHIYSPKFRSPYRGLLLKMKSSSATINHPVSITDFLMIDKNVKDLLSFDWEKAKQDLLEARAAAACAVEEVEKRNCFTEMNVPKDSSLQHNKFLYCAGGGP
ncbi:hypothetical protein POM88_051976 [Heracleum sosnowskyi]|uniref:Uncharacterized protein n=1 Tax=Heracleum sosnowskyi TaxID=360622 RepID=A0AAD8LY82_9APIA|nr:hypothetical protein POM88_051976 [Heracleum sosnowskyi]